MKKTKGQGTGTCAVWGLVKVVKELRGDVKKLVGLLQNVNWVADKITHDMLYYST